MIDDPHPSIQAEPAFASSEGLRALLLRLRAEGPGSWRRDREATELLRYSIGKYERLARKWDREPADVGYAAFRVMQTDAVVTARNPWGAVTTAIKRELISETMGERLLVSASRARKGTAGIRTAPTRAGEREWLYDRGLVTDPFEDGEEPAEVLRLRAALADVLELLIGLGWPELASADAVEYVMTRTGDAGSLQAARELLRKETDMPVRLGLSEECWPMLLRLLLGGKSRPGRPTYRGLVVRLMDTDSIDTILENDELVLQIVRAAPGSRLRDG